MGMHTEIVLGVALNSHTPDDVISVIKYMTSDTEEDKQNIDIPNHPLFLTDRWDIMFGCDSYYFDGDTNTTFICDRIDNMWHLTVRSNFKNYDSEIELFLDWIKPYLDTDGFIGYMRYEEDDDPTLIYHDCYKDVIKLVRLPNGAEEGKTIVLDDEYLRRYCIR